MQITLKDSFVKLRIAYEQAYNVHKVIQILSSNTPDQSI